MNVAALISATADIASEVEPPPDPDEALALVAAAVEADQELMAMCHRIADRHNAVREQWRSFDPAGKPPPGGGDPGCLSALLMPLRWLRALRSHATSSQAGGSDGARPLSALSASDALRAAGTNTGTGE